MCFAQGLTLTRDIFQTLFFVVVGAVAVLTYRRARKTLLQPIRTEVFKQQVELLSRVLESLVGKDEMQLREDFGIPELFEANASKLYDDYDRIWFGTVIDAETRPYAASLCPMAVARMDRLKVGNTDTDPRKARTTKQDGADRDPADIWKSYEVWEIRVPRKLVDKLAEIRRFAGSPLLPADLVGSLTEYMARAERNIHVLREVLAAAVPEMPARFPTKDDLNRAWFGRINNAYVKRFEHFEPLAQEIAKLVRAHYDTDRVLK